MISINAIVFSVIYLFPQITVRTLVIASTFDDLESTRAICTALRHRLIGQTSYKDLQRITKNIVTQKNVPVMLEDSEAQNQPTTTTVALCAVSANHTRCLIDVNKDDKFIDMTFKIDEGNCLTDPEVEHKSTELYLTIGKNIIAGIETSSIPPENKSIGGGICDKETIAKKICVGLRNDYITGTSLNEAQDVQKYSGCRNYVKLISQTRFTIDYYKVAVCYLSESQAICAINGYTKDQFIPVTYELQPYTTPTCIWDSNTVNIKSKEEYLTNANSLLNSPKKGFFGSLLKVLTLGYYK